MNAKRLLLGFVAGFLATLVGHQPALWLLNLAGLVNRPVYVMTGVPPFGVPSVISLALWGGVWGVILVLVWARKGRGSLLAATLFGAIFPTLVAVVIVAPLKGAPAKGGVAMLIAGLIINGVWGLVTALLYRGFVRER